MMEDFFEQQSEAPGMRLHKLELMNWGTFDSSEGRVFTMKPGGKTTLLVGENGAGKSTLLRLLAGTLDVDGGELTLGSNVTRSYFAQHQSEILAPDLTVLETLAQVGDGLGRTQLQTILGGFRFSGDEVEKKTRVLSGGERSRLALARM